MRTLIHRPAVGSSLGNKASSSVVALAQSSKHVIQIIQLLEERRMSFSFCLNKNEVLLLAGFGLLFQGLNLDRKGKLIQDSQRLLCSVISILERNNAPGAAVFKKVACAMISVDRFSKGVRALEDPAIRRKSDGIMPAPKHVSKSARKNQATTARASVDEFAVKQEGVNSRRSTTSQLTAHVRSSSQSSVSSAVSDSVAHKGYPKHTSKLSHQSVSLNPPNLDYLSFDTNPTPSLPEISPPSMDHSENFDRKHLVGHPTNQQPQTPFDSIFPSPDVFSPYISTASPSKFDWSTDVWSMTPELSAQPAQSVLSFSEEDLTSGEELSSCEIGADILGISIPSGDDLAALQSSDGILSL